MYFMIKVYMNFIVIIFSVYSQTPPYSHLGNAVNNNPLPSIWTIISVCITYNIYKYKLGIEVTSLLR